MACLVLTERHGHDWPPREQRLATVVPSARQHGTQHMLVGERRHQGQGANDLDGGRELWQAGLRAVFEAPQHAPMLWARKGFREPCQLLAAKGCHCAHSHNHSWRPGLLQECSRVIRQRPWRSSTQEPDLARLWWQPRAIQAGKGVHQHRPRQVVLGDHARVLAQLQPQDQVAQAPEKRRQPVLRLLQSVQCAGRTAQRHTIRCAQLLERCTEWIA
mmetsp:Transcript_108147/g.305767  ORF Transcript_108147/g.305767 Transcript_108147/m.305767 type:complete len:216 (+) Transcript_108147:225-872(+)